MELSVPKKFDTNKGQQNNTLRPPHFKTLPCISTHKYRHIEAYNTMIHNLPLLTRAPKINNILNTRKSLKCQRQLLSLKRLATNVRLYLSHTMTTGKKCSRPNWRDCLYLTEGLQFTF